MGIRDYRSNELATNYYYKQRTNDRNIRKKIVLLVLIDNIECRSGN